MSPTYLLMADAFLRWRGPELGLIGMSEFASSELTGEAYRGFGPNVETELRTAPQDVLGFHGEFLPHEIVDLCLAQPATQIRAHIAACDNLRTGAVGAHQPARGLRIHRAIACAKF